MGKAIVQEEVRRRREESETGERDMRLKSTTHDPDSQTDSQPDLD